MPKKTRREKLRASRRPMNMPVATPATTPQATEAPGPRATPAATATMGRNPVAPKALMFDYSYVYRDLRRILILAVSFFILLIVLSFVIH